jgi:N-acetylmuramoyl-L-alanine amidase
VKDLGVKHALFAVLLGVRMPSVLVETGFVTNPTEGERLTTSAYQTKVAKAIARGVERLMEERQQLAAR